VRWLRANAKEFKIDRDRIAAWGFSAGGNLACMLGTTTAGTHPQLEGKGGHPNESSSVNAVICYYGMLDLPELHKASCKPVNPFLQTQIAFDRLAVRTAIESYRPGSPKDAALRYAEASPFTYLTGMSAPSLFIHGDKDTKVPPEQSEAYHKKLVGAGGKSSLHILKGAPHDFVGEYEQEAIKKALPFLDEHLKVKK
jgi:dipeptidyl aminopeptidase/acylaminoacyl peptidase